MGVDIVLLKQKKTFWRLDVYPFVIFYVCALYQIITEFDEEQIMQKFIYVLAILIHCLTYLMGHWSVRCRKMIEYSQFKNNQLKSDIIQNCSHVFVTMEKKDRPRIYDICELWEDLVENKQVYYFHFQKKKFYYDKEKQIFQRLKPQTNQNLEYYIGKKGEKQQENFFDKNILNIPLKTFNELLKDQLMEPFSFFQFFSVSLWLMDENRFYSLMTLGLLFITSCTVVLQRMKTMLMFRSMKLSPQYIQVFRENKWIKISSEDLVPGDICQIQSASQVKQVDEKNGQSDMDFIKELVPFANYLPERLFLSDQSSATAYQCLPCDFLLLTGNVVVNEAILTGESTPQIKDSMQQYLDTKSENDISNLDIKNVHKSNVLYCGTEVLQTFTAETVPGTLFIYSPDFMRQKTPTPMVVGYVLKTGFDTAKGKLIRTVIYNNENVNIKQYDALALIFILLIFACISSGYVLIEGLKDPNRSRNKLFLRCIQIITTVVPPELPMIISIAVNSSILYLQKKRIYCTEPYRIPIVGNVRMCAFDKTGTLTSDELSFRGVIAAEDLNNNLSKLRTIDNLPESTLSVLAGCHSLITHEKKLLGDPIEKLFFEKAQWEYSQKDKSARNKTHSQSVQIHRLYPFRSDLKRMSSIAYWSSDDEKIRENRVLCKGAPETIMQLLNVFKSCNVKNVPNGYKESYEKYSKQGFRILALAFKKISVNEDFQRWSREEAEQNLEFAGFYVCDSPLKKDTAQQIKTLMQSDFDVCMITGDNILTAISVGKQLNLGPKEYLQVEESDKYEFVWINDDNQEKIRYSEVKNSFKNHFIKEFQKNTTLCLTGNIIAKMEKNINIKNLCEIISVTKIFARTTPAQKELIVSCFRNSGIPTLMCGDGTNDVGGLKKADVGIALVGLKNEDELKKEKQVRKERAKQQMDEQNKQLIALRNQQFRSFAEQQEKIRQIMNKRNEQINMNQELNALFDQESFKFGDACIAAPFTSKYSNSLKCVIVVLRQGICTLVTSVQTYKILSLTSILQAYSMSALHLEALKFSETQMTFLGITAAANYYYFSNSKPVKHLPKERPPKTIFELYFVISVIGQLCLHFYGMEIAAKSIISKYGNPNDAEISQQNEFKINNDEKFVPTFFNTVLFLFSLLSQTCIFLFNHGGEPHMESLSKNKAYMKWLLIPLISVFVMALNISSEVTYFFELQFENIPYEANIELLNVFFYTVSLNYILERGLKFLRYQRIPDWI